MYANLIVESICTTYVELCMTLSHMHSKVAFFNPQCLAQQAEKNNYPAHNSVNKNNRWLLTAYLSSLTM